MRQRTKKRFFSALDDEKYLLQQLKQILPELCLRSSNSIFLNSKL
jgi:hypothetical protein